MKGTIMNVLKRLKRSMAIPEVSHEQLYNSSVAQAMEKTPLARWTARFVLIGVSLFWAFLLWLFNS